MKQGTQSGSRQKMRPEQAEQRIVKWLKERVEEAGCRGLIVGLSGGIDSSVVSILCKKAFPDNTLGVMMPCLSHGDDLAHAKLLAESFNISSKTTELARALKEVFRAIEGEELDESSYGFEIANLKPRLRMAVLYYFANKLNYLVVGTDNKSEEYAGYFTKYGDGGVDILPIADLLKRDIKKMAQYLGVPKEIIEKAPSAGLWSGQTDEEEMGISYAQLDKAIEAIESGDTSGIDPEVLTKVQGMIAASQHKRQMPPMLKLGEGLE